jgi:hypothetical protein
LLLAVSVWRVASIKNQTIVYSLLFIIWHYLANKNKNNLILGYHFYKPDCVCEAYACSLDAKARILGYSMITTCLFFDVPT